jgi:hypothetical protein
VHMRLIVIPPPSAVTSEAWSSTSVRAYKLDAQFVLCRWMLDGSSCVLR